MGLREQFEAIVQSEELKNQALPGGGSPGSKKEDDLPELRGTIYGLNAGIAFLVGRLERIEGELAQLKG